MEAIYKYELELKDEQVISLPADAEILSIQEQGGSICAWVRLDTQKPERDRKIIVCGTGRPIAAKDMLFISTVQTGAMVWHFFEG